MILEHGSTAPEAGQPSSSSEEMMEHEQTRDEMRQNPGGRVFCRMLRPATGSETAGEEQSFAGSEAVEDKGNSWSQLVQTAWGETRSALRAARQLVAA